MLFLLCWFPIHRVTLYIVRRLLSLGYVMSGPVSSQVFITCLFSLDQLLSSFRTQSWHLSSATVIHKPLTLKVEITLYFYFEHNLSQVYGFPLKYKLIWSETLSSLRAGGLPHVILLKFTLVLGGCKHVTLNNNF